MSRRARRVRPKRAPGSTPALPLWMAGCLLIAALVYLSLPAKVGIRSRLAEAPVRRERHRRRAPRHRAAAAQSRAPRPSEAPQAAPQRLARAVLPLPIKRIVLDPGHGGAQAGTMAESGASEKEITLDLALRLRRLLQDASFEVLLTREADVTMSLEQRVAFANARRADVFVSIHVNWISRRDVRPVETYHVGPTDDPAVLKLAGAENRESGYSLGAYRRLLEKIYIDERRDESRAFAGAINAELYRALSAVNPGLDEPGREDGAVRRARRHRDAGDPGGGVVPVQRGRSAASHDRRLSSTDRRGPAAGHPILLEAASMASPRRRDEDMEDERNAVRGHRPRHLPQLGLGVERRAPRRGQLRGLARRHGGAQGRAEAGARGA